MTTESFSASWSKDTERETSSTAPSTIMQDLFDSLEEIYAFCYSDSENMRKELRAIVNEIVYSKKKAITIFSLVFIIIL